MDYANSLPDRIVAVRKSSDPRSSVVFVIKISTIIERLGIRLL